jgi:NAD(P)-dependent dehydrogenase (short-subunit alcohol dehydrogenase family)
MFDKDLLRGKRVLITGGGTGLGRSIGRRYVELGADLVMAAYINGEYVVIDGGKRYLGGTADADMLDWSDETWSAVRERTRGQRS